MQKLKWIILVCIIALGIGLRTYKIHEALGDWHSWRQADTASVAREYVKAGKIDLLHPHFHDLSSVPSGLDNPEGWRMVEFPLRDGLHAYLAMHFPGYGFLEWGRLLSIVFSAVTIFVLYLIGAAISGELTGLCTAFVYAILPYNVYYGRVILPEPMLVMFMMLSFYLYMRAVDTGKLRYWLTGLLSLTGALLMKPTALVVLLPMAGYWLATVRTHKLSGLARSFFLPVIAIIPYVLWRRHIAAYPMGIPASSWLFNSNGIRFKGAWFRWLFGERIGKLILGYWGLIPLGAGILKLGEKSKETFVYGGFLLGAVAYMTVIATGNVQHDYYQIQIMPAVAMLVGLGLSWMLTFARGMRRIMAIGFAGFALVLACALSWYEVKGYFWVNNRAMVEAGQKIDAITPKDALVIAPYMGDTAFLFQTNRRGWPIGGNIDLKIKDGATYYVTTTRDDEFNTLKKKYGVVEENDRYAIIHLQNNQDTK
jgi:hypothetical protein